MSSLPILMDIVIHGELQDGPHRISTEMCHTNARLPYNQRIDAHQGSAGQPAPHERSGVALDGGQAAQAPDQAPAVAQRRDGQERGCAVLVPRRPFQAPALSKYFT